MVKVGNLCLQGVFSRTVWACRNWCCFWLFSCLSSYLLFLKCLTNLIFSYRNLPHLFPKSKFSEQKVCAEYPTKTVLKWGSKKKFNRLDRYCPTSHLAWRVLHPACQGKKGSAPRWETNPDALLFAYFLTIRSRPNSPLPLPAWLDEG